VLPSASLARTAARLAGNTVIIAFALVPLCAIILSNLEPTVYDPGVAALGVIAGGTLAASLVAVALIYGLISASRCAWTRARLRRALRARLVKAGFDPDATSPGAQALRAAFWSDAQRDASRALAARIATRAGPVDMLQLIRAWIYESRVPLGILTALWALVSLTGGSIVIAGSGDPLAASMSCVLLNGSLFAVCAILLSSTAGALRGAGRLIERRELARDRRHVVALADLASAAGGLSLANGDDEALRGALSDEVVSAGELELVARPFGQEVP
jgi:hypothetical protein